MTRFVMILAATIVVLSASVPALAQTGGASLYMLAYVFNGANGSSTNVMPTLVGRFDNLADCSKNHASDVAKKVPGPAVEAMTISFICVESGNLIPTK